MLIQLYKGTVENAIPALTAGTTTSVAKHSKGHNALIVFANITGTGAWTIKIQGATSKNGTYLDLYDQNGNQVTTGSISGDRAQFFVGLPNYFKIVATEDTNGATIQVDYELLSV